MRTQTSIKQCPPDIRRVLVLSPALSPTLDYYLPYVVSRAGHAPIEVCDSSLPCAAPPTLEAGTWVVIFRHAHRSWLDALLGKSGQLTRVTWFIDDDIPALWREQTLPRLYAWRTFLNYLRIKGRLERLITDFAFSTPELAARHAAPGSEVWPPREIAVPPGKTPPLYFYHGTAAHRTELAWLAPIVAEVQRQVPEAWFEVFTDRRARELFRGIPRVRCIYPMSWPDYLAYTATFRADVGLAPLLDTPFNRARAPVKFFDIARTGAAGIFSTGPTYGSIVQDNVNGLLLPNEAKQWVGAIVRLLRSPVERHQLATQAQRNGSMTSPS